MFKDKDAPVNEYIFCSGLSDPVMRQSARRQILYPSSTSPTAALQRPHGAAREEPFYLVITVVIIVLAVVMLSILVVLLVICKR